MKRSLLLFLFLISHCLYANETESALGKKQVLVAGGAGFLGSHLCKRLLQTGCEVYCLDDLSTGFMRNIEPLMENPHFHFILRDVCLPVCLDVPFDEIFNLACPASPPHYQNDPVKTFKTNVLGAMNLLELARRTHAKIFQASTSEVYGDPFEHPQKENYWGNVNPIGIRSCYDEGKRGAETLFFDYHRQYKTRIKVARIFNTYGPQMEPEDGRVVSNFIMQALVGNPITIYGDGTQTRSFCYIDDLIEAILRFAATPDTVTGPINIGNPAEYTVREIAEKVVEFTGTKAEIVYRKLPSDDPKRRKPDITLAKEILGWQPTIGLDQGLHLTIEFFKTLVPSSEHPIATNSP